MSLRNGQFVLFFIIGSFLSSCSTVISEKTILDDGKYPNKGYLAFKTIDGTEMNLIVDIERIETKKYFTFSLNNEIPNSFSLFIGPFIVYQKYFEEKKDPPLKILSLPDGKYRIKYLRRRMGEKFDSYKASNDEFTIYNEKMTYIGTYYLQPKNFIIFPIGVKGTVVNDGKERSKEMGLENEMVEEICQMVKNK
jgi:hypothetical protein